MTTLQSIPPAELDDARLVADSLQGNREAFRGIVQRYQNLISSLAFSATANISQSEDIAQETFVTAWKQLGHLREPGKLRPWLCRIARFIISKQFRQLRHEPAFEAESVEALDRCPSDEPLPPDRVISQEEKAILWRAIERVPEIYRETLVLYYREHQSLEAVAQGLDLTEDAARQRLFRGRKFLEEQFLELVAGALEETRPDKMFTASVIAALPAVMATAKAAGLTATAGKGGSMAKVAGLGTLGSFLSAGAVFLFSLFGVFSLAGRWIGRRMGLACRQSLSARKRTIQFWRTLAIGFATLTVWPWFVPSSALHARPWLFDLGGWSISAFYWLVVIALAVWSWQRRRDARQPQPDALEPTAGADRSYNTWVTLGMLGPACITALFLYSCFFSNSPWSQKPVSAEEAQRLIAKRADASFVVFQYRDGSKELSIRTPDDQRIPLATPLTTNLIAALAAKGIRYETLVENQDFHNGGVRGWLVFLCALITAAGTVLLLRRPGTESFLRQKMTTPAAEQREKKLAGIVLAAVLLVMGVLTIAFKISHQVTPITNQDAQKVIVSHPKAGYMLFRFEDGTQELWIWGLGKGISPQVCSKPDAATTNLLAKYKVDCKTLVQGRDFGFRDRTRGLLTPLAIVLTATGAWVLWRSLKIKT